MLELGCFSRKIWILNDANAVTLMVFGMVRTMLFCLPKGLKIGVYNQRNHPWPMTMELGIVARGPDDWTRRGISGVAVEAWKIPCTSTTSGTFLFSCKLLKNDACHATINLNLSYRILGTILSLILIRNSWLQDSRLSINLSLFTTKEIKWLNLWM